MGFTNILVAYDGGQPSERALDHAMEMVRHYPEAKLTVLYVYTVTPIAVADSVMALPASVQDELLGEAQERLKAVNERIASLPSAKSELLEGSPGETIVGYAERNQCDLIIAGSRGLGAFREMVLGSVSHYVLQHTKLPLLIVK